MILQLFGSFKYFLNFGLVDSLDIAEVFFGGHDDACDGTEASTFEFSDISSIDTALLEFLNLEERYSFDFFDDILNLLLRDFIFLLGLFLLPHV